MPEKKITKIGLIRGGHEIPGVSEYIFENDIQDVTDLQDIAKIVMNKLADCKDIYLYVTGLTVALVEVIKYCQRNCVGLTLWHYNSATGDYYPQEVL